jgi:hypothetical protein
MWKFLFASVNADPSGEFSTCVDVHKSCLRDEQK